MNRLMHRPILLRLGGVGLIGLAWYMGQLLKGAMHDGPPHPATALEFMLALFSFVMASGGAMLLVHGAGLFRQEEGQPRIRPHFPTTPPRR